MPIVTAGVFRLTYELRTDAAPGADIQFGMDFELRQPNAPLPLSQLIWPATSVGTNTANLWNVDNHEGANDSVRCLVFADASTGTLKDGPREISRRNRGLLRTKFAVYRVDPKDNVVQSNGIAFGYHIDTDATEPRTVFDGFVATKISNEQKTVVTRQCRRAKFS